MPSGLHIMDTRLQALLFTRSGICIHFKRFLVMKMMQIHLKEFVNELSKLVLRVLLKQVVSIYKFKFSLKMMGV